MRIVIPIARKNAHWILVKDQYPAGTKGKRGVERWTVAAGFSKVVLYGTSKHYCSLRYI